jgi:hypothetical protein
MQLGRANLGDKGNEGKDPSPLGPRVGAAVGVERYTLGMRNLVTRVTKAESHHHWGRVCGSGGGCREMQLGDASLGDEGDEGKEPSSLEPRVGAVVGVERCNLGKQANLGDKGERRQRAIIAGAACGSGGGCREMQLGNANLGDKGDEGKEPSSLEPRVWEPRWVSRDATWKIK